MTHTNMQGQTDIEHGQTDDHGSSHACRFTIMSDDLKVLVRFPITLQISEFLLTYLILMQPLLVMVRWPTCSYPPP